MASDEWTKLAPDALLSLLAGLLVIPLGFWARHAHVSPGGVPLLDSSGRWYWLGSLIVALVLAALFQFLDRPVQVTAPRGSWSSSFNDAVDALPTAWILPLVTQLTVAMLLGVYHALTTTLVFALATFVALLLASSLRAELLRDSQAGEPRARSLYALLIHLVAFVALSMIYINKLRSLFSATAVLLVVSLLLFELTVGDDVPAPRRLLYALAGGMVLGEITWVLNYWRATGWTGGAALLIFFYFAAGLILNQIRRGVTRRDLAEYGGVSAVAFIIVAAAVLR